MGFNPAQTGVWLNGKFTKGVGAADPPSGKRIKYVLGIETRI